MEKHIASQRLLCLKTMPQKWGAEPPASNCWLLNLMISVRNVWLFWFYCLQFIWRRGLDFSKRAECSREITNKNNGIHQIVFSLVSTQNSFSLREWRWNWGGFFLVAMETTYRFYTINTAWTSVVIKFLLLLLCWHVSVINLHLKCIYEMQ